jgi:hypothetical protein
VYNYLLLPFGNLVVRRRIASELVDLLLPSVWIQDTSHYQATQLKAKDSLHILHGNRHLARRKVEQVGLRPPPVIQKTIVS